MNLKQKLKLKFTNEPLMEDVTLHCKKCKMKTPHTEHGFRKHNYRLTCDICNKVNYSEYI